MTQPNGIVKIPENIIVIEKNKEINQIGSVVESCLIAIAT
jgi:hypothetical protein